MLTTRRTLRHDSASPSTTLPVGFGILAGCSGESCQRVASARISSDAQHDHDADHIIDRTDWFTLFSLSTAQPRENGSGDRRRDDPQRGEDAQLEAELRAVVPDEPVVAAYFLVVVRHTDLNG
jgi:hypothetical protein